MKKRLIGLLTALLVSMFIFACVYVARMPKRQRAIVISIFEGAIEKGVRAWFETRG